MTYYPVIIPTLNRFDKLKTCIASLLNNEEARETELIISVDFPPAEKYMDGYKKIKEYIPSISGFKKITVFYQDKNLGSTMNSFFLEDYALSKYDAYIYTEDDNIFSPCFLKFMNKGLEKYRNDESVLAVCGYSYPINWKSEKNSILQRQYFSGWGFAEWGAKRNEMISHFTPEYLATSLKSGKNRKIMKKISFKNYCYASNYLFLDKMPIMDITRSIYMCLMDRFVLMPTNSLVKNDGLDGSGEHNSLANNESINNQKVTNIFASEKINAQEIYSKELEIFNQNIEKKSIKARFVVILKYFLLSLLGYKKAKSFIGFWKRIKK